MGQNFAERLREFLLAKQIPTSAFGVIQANPERSKHLETATLTIYGYPIDFVNLRAESYSSTSRIPTIKFGSPLEDALRRDITINALFYNIHSEAVEDFCGTGFSDLEQGIIRTPLAPRETLLDDPLRLLRVVRFATRLCFRIEPELMAAIGDAQVDNAFRGKISRERVGIELDKILRDRNAYRGIEMLHQLGVFNLVFDVPEEVREQVASQAIPFPAPHTVETILRMFRSREKTYGSAKEYRLALLVHCLLPHTAISVTRGPARPTLRPKEESLVSSIIRDSLKFTNQDISDVGRLLDNLDQLIEMVLSGQPADPVATGRLIRTLGSHWRLAFDAATIRTILKGRLTSEEEARELFSTAANRVQQLGLAQAWEWRTLLSGAEVQELLRLREGKAVGAALAALMDWQFMNPQGDKERAGDYLRQQWQQRQ